MDLERYAYHKKAACREYGFYSEGPRGKIRKIVRFGLGIQYEIVCYNLSFGDCDPQSGEIDYTVVSNNGDTGKVLATIAAIAVNFMHIHPDLFVHVKGADEARSRLYQMGISKVWNRIIGLYQMRGVVNEKLAPFRRNIRYEAFLIRLARPVNLQEPKEYYMSLSPKSKKHTPSDQFNEFIFIDPPIYPGEAEEMARVKEFFDKVRPTEEFMEELDELRQRQKKWFMIYDDEPANEQEAAERAEAKRMLDSLGLSREWLRKLRIMHGIIEA